MEIMKEYSLEILEIQYELRLIKEGDIREFLGSGAYLATRALKVEEKLNDLLNRIDKGLPSRSSLVMQEIFNAENKRKEE